MCFEAMHELCGLHSQGFHPREAAETPQVPVENQLPLDGQTQPNPGGADARSQEDASKAQPPLDPEMVRLSDVEAKPIEWLWQDRIAIGKLTILVGDPGVGKSTVSLEMAANVTLGHPWPDRRDDPISKGSAILLSGEDGLADTIKPRLVAAQADVAKVLAITGMRKKDGRVGPVNLKTDIPRLEEKILEAGDARLVVIDPITCYLGETDDSKNAAVRALLAPLAAMAERLRVAIVLVTHFNKTPGHKATSRIMGSMAFGAAARAVWVVGRDPDDPERILMLQAKNNLARRASGLAYRIVEGRVRWDSEPVEMTADELLAYDLEPPKPPRRIDEASSFLRSLLADGQLPSTAVYERGKSAGLSERTLDRAKKALGVRSAKVPREDETGQEWVWWLPSGTGEAEVEDRSTGTLGSLGNHGEVSPRDRASDASPGSHAQPEPNGPQAAQVEGGADAS